jgi:tubulin--tyrosine ligase-like protein 12
MKNNLAKTVNNALGHVKWLQKTYDLETHLPAFIGEFQERQRVRKDNHWIIKPPNLARSMDMVVTNNLDAIIRLMETGPKLAQKYIHRPLTLFGNKIDMRFVVLVRSVIQSFFFGRKIN